VASELADLDADETLLIAAVLHDVVEDSDTPAAMIAARFGPRVAQLVTALTEDPRIEDWVERKRALRVQVDLEGVEAATIYAADKLANLREMRRLYAEQGEEAIDLHKAPTLDLRMEAWWDDLAIAIDCGVPEELSAALRVELRAFEADRRIRV
jgi:(p)ppGpp synthase/HD superfamily hydrolase